PHHTLPFPTRRSSDLALVPDAVFYLAVSPKILVERNLRKHAVLDYWESGMDMHRSSNMYGSFIEYQRLIQKEFKAMQTLYGFETDRKSTRLNSSHQII